MCGNSQKGLKDLLNTCSVTENNIYNAVWLYSAQDSDVSPEDSVFI